MSDETREMTPEEISDQIVSRKRPRKWLAADLAAIIERAEKRGRRAALPVPAPDPLRAAVLYGPEGVTFPNLPHHPTGPDVLDAVAAWMDKIDDRDTNPYVSRAVQRHLRKWAEKLRAALREGETP